MSLAEELQQLAELRSSGALTDFEFETAKRKLLAAESSASTFSAAPNEHFSQIHAHNEVAQLDRQWQINRDKYLVRGRHNSYIPTKGSSIAQGLFIGLFGTFWTLMALGMSGGGSVVGLVFPAFGVMFALFGIYSAFEGYHKAEQYEEARQQYEQERARLLRK